MCITDRCCSWLLCTWQHLIVSLSTFVQVLLYKVVYPIYLSVLDLYICSGLIVQGGISNVSLSSWFQVLLYKVVYPMYLSVLDFRSYCTRWYIQYISVIPDLFALACVSFYCIWSLCISLHLHCISLFLVWLQLLVTLYMEHWIESTSVYFGYILSPKMVLCTMMINSRCLYAH
jgi:hypothetical protein